MTETQFVKNLKKWFWGSFLIQMVVVMGGALYFGGSLQSTVAQHSTDISGMKLEMTSKADIQMVLRIKADQDKRADMILQNTQDIKDTQQKLYDILINHLSKEGK